MKKLIKLIALWLFPVFFVLMLTFAINVFISDFRLSHQSHMVFNRPFSWSKYFIHLPLKKFLINTFDSKETGLPPVYLYLDEQSQQKLLSKTPNSTKLWSTGSLLNENGVLQTVQVRYRGDNPQNWLFQKKALRIKTRKKEMHGRKRYYEYTHFKPHFFVANDLANRMKLLASNSKLVELFINGESNGIFTEDERFDENFLRRNKIMPVNLYKGEISKTELRIGIDINLFNNPGSWTKTAIFNQRDYDDKSDLENFLSILQSAETRDKDFDELFNHIDVDMWASYSVHRILAQNYHQDHYHNLRIAIDPWNGFVYPIVRDPAFKTFKSPDVLLKDIFPLESSTDDLLTLLNRSSLFLDKKYKKLFDYTVNHKILNNEKNYLDNIYKNLKISGNRDPQIDINKTLKTIEIYKDDLKLTENLIKNKLYEKPISSWKQSLDKINIFVEGELPVSNIKLAFDSQIPEWVGIDSNYNGVIEDHENKFFSEGKKYIVIPARFYSNRVAVNNRKIEKIRSGESFPKPCFKILYFSDLYIYIYFFHP